ncbi:MAG: hypothetical protein AAFY15_08225, partial [Cyanobacteria bacterium J06648_11]
FEAQLDEAFEWARTNPEKLGHHVDYERVGNAFRLYYYPETGEKVDLELEVELSQECAIWWATFMLQAILGVTDVFGIPTPVSQLRNLAAQIASNPNVIQACSTVVVLTFSFEPYLGLLKVLYDYGYLSQAMWLAANSIGWWAVVRFLAYLIGVVSPVPTPAQALFIANAVIVVTKLSIAVSKYPTACGEGDGLCPVSATATA